MARRREHRISTLGTSSRAAVAAMIATVFVLAMFASQPAQAQTFTMLHTFSGTPDGSTPIAGLTGRAAGNFYGTTEYGGRAQCPFGCGTVYKVVRHGSSWVETPIYSFGGSPDGANPMGGVIFGPDGALYGITQYGGTGSCPSGCGTVFKLQPSPTACKTVLCPWRGTILYSFASQSDGEYPQDEVVFDQAGNLYGTTWAGGAGPCDCGTVFKLTHNADGSWSKSTLYSFQGGPNDGAFPIAGLTLDSAGNIYGTAGGGLPCSSGDCGTLFELTPSGPGWVESIVHFFTGGSGGQAPVGGLIFDGAGNLYGTTSEGGQGLGTGDGTVYGLTPGHGGWNFAMLYSFNPNNNEAITPQSKLTMDAAGDLYGSSISGGAYLGGTVYRLTRAGGGWVYTSLHDFNGLDDGFFLTGGIVLDAGGNVYGTTSKGLYPSPDDGTIFEITP